MGNLELDGGDDSEGLSDLELGSEDSSFGLQGLGANLESSSENFKDFDKGLEINSENPLSTQNNGKTIEGVSTGEIKTDKLETVEEPSAKIVNKDVKENYEYEKIQCLNEKLEGNKHPVTKVPFEHKKLVYSDGRRIEGTFAQFPSAFEVELSPELRKASFEKQKDELMYDLQMAIDKKTGNRNLRSQFTKDEIESIEYGILPERFVWNHSEEEGIMQLVDADIHDKTAHTGGMSLWGQGYRRSK